MPKPITYAGKSIGFFKLGCSATSSMAIQYWKSDSSCSGKPDFDGNLDLTTLAIPDFISKAIDETGFVSRPFEYGTCVDASDLESMPSWSGSAQINNVACMGPSLQSNHI